MSKAKSSARSTGNNVIDTELSRIWDKINSISESLDNIKSGSMGTEDRGSFRFVEIGSDIFIEVRSTKGWARLPVSFNLISKKE